MGTPFMCLVAQCFILTVYIQNVKSLPVIPLNSTENAIDNNSTPDDTSSVNQNPDTTPEQPSLIDTQDPKKMDFSTLENNYTDFEDNTLVGDDEDISPKKINSEDISRPIHDDDLDAEISNLLKILTASNTVNTTLTTVSDTIDANSNETDSLAVLPTEPPKITDSCDQETNVLNINELEPGTPVELHGNICISAHFGPNTTGQTFTKPSVPDPARYFFNSPSNGFFPYYFFNDCFNTNPFYENFCNYFNNFWNYCGYCIAKNWLNLPWNYYFPNQFNFEGVGHAYGNVDILRKF